MRLVDDILFWMQEVGESEAFSRLMTVIVCLAIGFWAGHSWVLKYGPLQASVPFYSQNSVSNAQYPVAPQPFYSSQTEYPDAPAEPEDIYYRNCSQARAAGAAPIHYGEPGYAPHLDRDGDGIACE